MTTLSLPSFSRAILRMAPESLKQEEFSSVCKDFEVATDFSPSDICPNLVDMAPRNLDKLFNIDIGVKFQSLISDKEFPNFPSYREVGGACRIEEQLFC